MAKPTVLPEWDETEVNSVEPDATHKSEGWLAPAGVPEKPPYQSFNFWQNNVWKWLNELNIKGMLGYDNLTNYIANLSYVVGSDGYIYQCVINNGPASSTVDPVGDGTGTWLVQIFNNDNIAINQDFSIWQKAISFTNPASSVYTADGYFVSKTDGDGTAPSINVKKNTTDMEDAFEQCMELEITNVGVQGTTVRWECNQFVEDYKKYRGKGVTLAFRVKASTAITLNAGKLFIYDGVGSGSVAVTSITTDWVTYSVTLSSIAATSDRLEARFQLIPTGDGTISTTGSIYIQWMKLELGSVFTGPPIPRPTTVEKLLTEVPFPSRGKIDGLIMSNGTDSDHDIDVSVGEATDSTNAIMMQLPDSITKQIDAAWVKGNDAGGMFTGAVAADIWYHVFAIRIGIDGPTEIGFDTSITASNRPVEYTHYRRVGSVLTDGSSNILPFIQIGDKFRWDDRALDFSAVVPATTQQTLVLSVPTGIPVLAQFLIMMQNNGTQYLIVTEVDETDVVPTASLCDIYLINAAAEVGTVEMTVKTNVSAQINWRCSVALGTVRIWTKGWTDLRGKGA